MSTIARSDRPMSRWISLVRPDVVRREIRCGLEPGSMPYSAVTHPFPESRSQGGISASTAAVHSTRVRPIAISTDPGVISV
jgi:hypothetical protein